MSKIIRVSHSINDNLLSGSDSDVKRLERMVKHDLVQRLVHALYDSEVKKRRGICGTEYYIELNIVSNNELDLLERAKRELECRA